MKNTRATFIKPNQMLIFINKASLDENFVTDIAILFCSLSELFEAA